MRSLDLLLPPTRKREREQNIKSLKVDDKRREGKGK
jgi:hypothetical protein